MMDLDFRQWVLDPQPESDLYWKSWMKNNPSQVQELLLAKELLLKLEFHDKTSDRKNYDRILDNVLAGNYSRHSGKYFQSQNSWISIRKYLRVAAVLLLVGFLWSYFYISDNTSSEQVIAKSEVILKENPAGRKSQVFLPDGTVVWLNSESRVTYVVDLEKNRRIVNLIGEAFFDVAKDKERPFTVNTTNFSVAAIGTKFNIKAYPEDLSHMVSLSEGIVSVHGVNDRERKETILNPGESLSIDEKGGQSEATFSPEVTIGWRMGILQFKDASFEEVIRSLERWYGKEFLIVGSVKGKWMFTSEFHNETLDNVLKSMSYAKGFDYQIDDKSVKIIF